jgi:hypothetical protein
MESLFTSQFYAAKHFLLLLLQNIMPTTSRHCKVCITYCIVLHSTWSPSNHWQIHQGVTGVWQNLMRKLVLRWARNVQSRFTLFRCGNRHACSENKIKLQISATNWNERESTYAQASTLARTHVHTRTRTHARTHTQTHTHTDYTLQYSINLKLLYRH